LPYHKDKQQAFQAAQQGVNEAEKIYLSLDKNSPEFASELSHLKNEINEAYQQIENALEVASEHQRNRLEQYKKDLEKIASQVNKEEE
jgi:peptidoglycan hydrolase CwlO-like protein